MRDRFGTSRPGDRVRLSRKRDEDRATGGWSVVVAGGDPYVFAMPLRDLLVPLLPFWCCAAVLGCALALGTARDAGASAQPRLIGVFGAWRAVTHHAGGRLVCYAYTRSVSAAPHLAGRGNLAGRGSVVLSVTERAGAPRDAVALSVGFSYPPGADASVTAGAARLRFYTAQRSAFARSGAGATRAFAAADRAIARSPAPRGRVVVDTFSLDGFVAAHRAIEKACPLHA